MTLFSTKNDASFLRGTDYPWKQELRRCNGCQTTFHPIREKQQCCSPRCRQRIYVERKDTLPLGYHGA